MQMQIITNNSSCLNVNPLGLWLPEWLRTTITASGGAPVTWYSATQIRWFNFWSAIWLMSLPSPSPCFLSIYCLLSKASTSCRALMGSQLETVNRMQEPSPRLFFSTSVMNVLSFEDLQGFLGEMWEDAVWECTHFIRFSLTLQFVESSVCEVNPTAVG